MFGPQVMCYHPSSLPFIVWECLRAPRLNLWGRDRGVGLSVKGQVDELIKAPSDWKSRTSHRKLLASRLGFFDFLGICFCIRIQLLSWLWFLMDCECVKAATCKRNLSEMYVGRQPPPCSTFLKFQGTSTRPRPGRGALSSEAYRSIQRSIGKLYKDCKVVVCGSCFPEAGNHGFDGHLRIEAKPPWPRSLPWNIVARCGKFSASALCLAGMWLCDRVTFQDFSRKRLAPIWNLAMGQKAIGSNGLL